MKVQEQVVWSVEEITIGSGGERRGNASAEVTGVSIDTRTLRPGDLFVAVKGPRFDGHDFVAQALEQGASGAVVSRHGFQAREGAWRPLLDRHFLILVEDPLTALQSLAAWHRTRFDLPLIGVTGSNGKTTTKEMIAAILSRRGPVLKTEGNLNNHLGLPLSLLRLDASHRAAVLEIGISLKGEMRCLCEIARPTVGLITNIGPAHLEFLGSIEGVAEEKGSLFEAVRPDGTAIINLDDPHLAPWEKRLSVKWTFALDAPADVTATEIRPEGAGIGFLLTLRRTGEAGRVHLATSGRHQVANALGAAAVACALGYRLEEIRDGLADFRPVALRAEVLEAEGKTLLLDAYNANPASIKAAIEMLAAFPRREGGSSRKIALLGDMLELGTFSESAHRGVGEAAAQNGIDLLIAVGRWAGAVAEGARQAGMAGEKISAYADLPSLQKEFLSYLRKGDVLLIKGSRGMRMETVLAWLGVERSDRGKRAETLPLERGKD
ncbi:UDP-N-acetylmuramoyl-tripeptide--D-alanyl-D-alanine ligase [Candidatus Manganitrophus noduliformans]|uniref:UDP-N-acetylmuramoyl-tripeptide--D-alanyl-D-alanine ligase n=1 Tax=Candidatus Manganitrophus noduliformans TaxID=2606439 RepID=A0A7X6DNG8_9BACT|nr:UDP-N-acetylmuramoyl-tripeptide--D-alanyl-D-alanine ligase [Candidatus Manganitrophus noduliformans]NKE70395.1 UDP-N-acetylmuramoyl-tripeptide--D-alanyl-D-alanine ligase [Candidatus Manganitrophus noduliformans]